MLGVFPCAVSECSAVTVEDRILYGATTGHHWQDVLDVRHHDVEHIRALCFEHFSDAISKLLTLLNPLRRHAERECTSNEVGVHILFAASVFPLLLW